MLKTLMNSFDFEVIFYTIIYEPIKVWNCIQYNFKEHAYEEF